MQNKEYVKNEMHEQLVKSSSMSESNALFVNFVKQLFLVVPNNADEKLSKSAPLGKFINTVNYKNFVLQKYLTSQTLTEYDELHLFYKDQIAVLFLWFPILLAINANLTDVLYYGLSITANINAIRIFLYLVSFVSLIIYFFFNFKIIKLSDSIFFLYLLVFIIQSNFLFSENFNQFKIDYKIFFSGNIPNIIEYIKDYNIGLEVQSIYMMIGSFAALLYFINFNNKKFENTLKLQIIITTSIIAAIYLYFTFNMMMDFF